MTENDFFGVPLLELIFKIYDTFKAISQNGESSMNLSSINGLLICLLENGKGKLDHVLPRIVNLAVDGLLTSKKKKKQATYLELLTVCFYYNVQMTMRLVVETNSSDSIF